MGLTQLNFDGLTKIKTAIELLRRHEPEEGYYVCDGGGKDSTVITGLCIEGNIKHESHYGVSPIDPPELRGFLREHRPETIWDYGAKGFWNIVAQKGLPYRNRRYCCELIKHRFGKGRVKLLGIRQEESHQRKQKYTKYYQQTGKRPPTFQVLPILTWNEAEVWEYIEGNGLAYCSLYDEGFSRLGCIMCPLAGRPQMRYEAKRWPKIARLWWIACQRYFNMAHKPEQERYKSAADMWRWWIGMDPPEPEKLV